jgi:hypothetical protein
MIYKARAEWRRTGRDGSDDISTEFGMLTASPYFKIRLAGDIGCNLSPCLEKPMREAQGYLQQ